MNDHVKQNHPADMTIEGIIKWTAEQAADALTTANLAGRFSCRLSKAKATADICDAIAKRDVPEGTRHYTKAEITKAFAEGFKAGTQADRKSEQDKAEAEKKKAAEEELATSGIASLTWDRGSNEAQLIVDALERKAREFGPLDLYTRHNVIVTPTMSEGKTHDNKDTQTPGIAPAPMRTIWERLNTRFRCQEIYYTTNKQGDEVEKRRPIELPERFVETLMVRPHKQLRVVRGLVSAPMVFPDGRYVSEPGYDPQSALYFSFDADKFPAIPSDSKGGNEPAIMPSAKHRDEALARLRYPFKDYIFATPNDETAHLAYLITAVVRATLPNVPMFLVNAKQQGTGKTELALCGGVLQTGYRPAVMDAGDKPEEFGKRFDATLIAGNPLVFIDNLNDNSTLAGGFIASALTSPTKDCRWLGHSEMVKVDNTWLAVATGNNILCDKDMVRRVVGINLTTDVENPMFKVFDFNPVEMVLEQREQLVTDINTIMLHHYQNPPETMPTPLGSFEMWSDTVRAALMAAGMPDPIATLVQAVEQDEGKMAVRRIMELWWDRFANCEISVKELIAELNREDPIGTFDQNYPNATVRANPELRDLFWEVGSRDSEWNPHAVGLWLRAHPETMMVAGEATSFRASKGTFGGSTRWRLARVTEDDRLVERWKHHK